jgi:hypothetical protein
MRCVCVCVCVCVRPPDGARSLPDESGLLLVALLALDEALVDVRDDTAAGDRRLDERVELLVTADRELQMPRRNALHLEVLGGVARKLKNLRGQVLQDGGRVHGGGRANAALGGRARLKVAVDTANRELGGDEKKKN